MCSGVERYKQARTHPRPTTDAEKKTTRAAFGPQRHTMQELTKEQQILIAMRKTLAAVVKDITPPPGMKHPLSEQTIADVRQCLALISAREKELADTKGRAGERPYYADELQASHVVPIARLSKGKKPN